MREINCEKLHNHHVVITHAQPEVNFSSNRIGHVSCIKARGLRPRADYLLVFYPFTHIPQIGNARSVFF